MTDTWQVQQAKQRLSQLLADAERSPQTITKHGRRYAVVVSAEAFDRLVGARDFKAFLRDAPALPELPPRDTSGPRPVEL